MTQNNLKYILGLIILLAVSPILAQQEAHFSLYRYHFNMLNPALTGTQGGTLLNLSFRDQWAGIKDSPQTQAISYSSPTSNERIGVGFSAVNDKTFIEQQTQVFLNFSYLLRLNEKLNLHLGIQAGANGYAINGTSTLNIYGMSTTAIDPFLVDNSLINPNIGVGLYLKHPNYYFSLSSPKILRSKRFRVFEGMVTTASDRPHFYITGGSFIKINNRWDAIPSFLFSFVNAAPMLTTLNMSLAYNKKFEFGLEYNFQNGIGGTLMFHALKSCSVGYAYITSTHRELNQFSKGTHEVLLRIKLKEHNPLEQLEQLNVDETTDTVETNRP